MGVIGCGRIARAVHIPVLRRSRRVDLVAVADRGSEARDAMRRVAGGAPIVSDLDSLLAHGADAVVVATSTASHSEVALDVLAAGRHLYLEKPLATCIEDGLRVVRAAGAARVVAAMGLNRRRHPVFATTARTLDSGALGAVISVETTYDEPQDPASVPAWKNDRTRGGGALLDLATHHVDLVRHLLGELELVDVERRSILTDDDEGTLRARVGGAPATIRVSYRRGRTDVVRVVCEKGVLVADRFAGTVDVSGRSVRSRELAALRLRRLVRPDTEPSYGATLGAFVDRIAGADIEVPTVADGFAALDALATTSSDV